MKHCVSCNPPLISFMAIQKEYFKCYAKKYDKIHDFKYCFLHENEQFLNVCKKLKYVPGFYSYNLI